MVENLIIAKNIAEAVSCKASCKASCKESSAYLAGGTEINRLNGTVDATTLVSIGRIAELDGMSYVDDPRKGSCTTSSKFLRIGSMCTFQEIVESKDAPLWLKDACRFMASRTKRNMATIGGNVALMRDDSYLYATLLAVGSLLELVDIEGNTMFKCTRKYMNEHKSFKDCLIAAVLVPKNAVVASRRYANTAESHAVLTMGAGIVNGELRLAAALKGTGVFLMPHLSDLISKGATEEEVLDAAKNHSGVEVKSDMFGGEAYKRYLLGITAYDLAKKVLAQGGGR